MTPATLARYRATALRAGGSLPRDACRMRARVRRASGLGPREIEFVASTAKVADDGKIIRESAWSSSIKRIRDGGRTPKVLAGHIPGYPDGRQPAIGKIVVKSVRMEPGVGLIHRIEFASEEVHPEGPRYYAAYRDGYLTDVSVGWDKEVLAPKSEWQSRGVPEVADLDWMDTSAVAFGADDGAVKRARAAGHVSVAALLDGMLQRRVASGGGLRGSAKNLERILAAMRSPQAHANCAAANKALLGDLGIAKPAGDLKAMVDELAAAAGRLRLVNER